MAKGGGGRRGTFGTLIIRLGHSSCGPQNNAVSRIQTSVGSVAYGKSALNEKPKIYHPFYSNGYQDILRITQV